MVEKLLTSPEVFSDYELIEVLLYSVIPRKNTNDVAHKLFRAFGSLKNIFNATAEQLIAVDGVGKRTASQIILFGQILRRIDLTKEDTCECNTLEQVKKMFIDKFNGMKLETFIVTLLDKKYKVINEICFSDSNVAKVSADMSEIAELIALNKPKFLIIAHNHPSGHAFPSFDDDVTTKKINVLCEMHGVTLLDHVIVAGKNVFSYHHSDGKLDKIKQDSRLNAVFGNRRS